MSNYAGVAGAVTGLALLWVLFSLLQPEEIERRDERGRTALIVAAENGALQEVRRLLDRGAVIDARDDCEWTAMMRAAAGGHLEILSLLLDRGAELNPVDKGGYSALLVAVINNQTATASLLIARGADASLASDPPVQTPLMWARKNANTVLVVALTQAGNPPRPTP